MRYWLVLLFALFTPAAMACTIGHETYGKTYTDAPADLCKLLNRCVACYHFAGEEPYDKERADFLAEQFQTLRCKEAGEALSLLRKKYKNDPAAMAMIEDVRAQYGFGDYFDVSQ
jgi:hypothetical protein